jgi:8-oxo-dGTP diphosphatase
MSTLLVAAAIIEYEGKILLARRKADAHYPLFWEFPGGKVEQGEDPKDCVVREIREELAIDIAVEAMYDTVFYRYPERPVLVLAYHCRWLGGEIRDIEVSEHCWVYPADVVKYELLPADIPLAMRISEEFANADTARL